MCHLRTVTDLDECRDVWRRAIPDEKFTDLWEVRECFQRRFQRPPFFVVAEGDEGIHGLLPLSWIEESGCYGYFPGETWEGKTWLEQNRIPLRGSGVLEALLARCPAPYHLRYLLPFETADAGEGVVDEVGYLFLPPQYDYDVEAYFRREFSHKGAKEVRRNIAAVESRGVTCRYDDLADFDHLVRLSIERFGKGSYFFDPRFREGFCDMMRLFHERGWLRMTTVLVEGEPAAVDMGCMYRGVYTLVAGGTHHEYKGVAKLINVHHMRRACEERLQQVDFLCGDFLWKKLFHLTPRPLYLLSNAPVANGHGAAIGVGGAANVQ